MRCPSSATPLGHRFAPPLLSRTAATTRVGDYAATPLGHRFAGSRRSGSLTLSAVRAEVPAAASARSSTVHRRPRWMLPWLWKQGKRSAAERCTALALAV